MPLCICRPDTIYGLILKNVQISIGYDFFHTLNAFKAYFLVYRKNIVENVKSALLYYPCYIIISKLCVV